jgi:hypothetical protein
MFHTRDLTCQWSPKGYIFDCLSRGEITWKFTTFNRSYRTSESRKTLKIVFCPRHYFEDCVLRRVPFPVFEKKHVHKCDLVGRDSSVGIATRYGLDVHGSNPGGGEIFCTRPDRPWGPPSLLYEGYRVSFPGVERPGHGVDHPPHLAPRLKKE